MKILHLTLKKEWFDMILSGEKTEEYREIKPHWFVRLFDETKGIESSTIKMSCNLLKQKDSITRLAFNKGSYGFQFKEIDIVRFKNGYQQDAPYFDIELKGIEIRGGVSDWGALAGEEYFVLKLGEIIKSGDEFVKIKTMKTKEDIIEQGWSSTWLCFTDEEKKEVLENNGYYNGFNEKVIDSIEWNEQLYDYHSNKGHIPYDLIGVEKNNGWTSVCDLPKQDCNVWVRTERGKKQTDKFVLKRNDFHRTCKTIVTHYSIIKELEDPIHK